jgi:hypothetical protein
VRALSGRGRAGAAQRRLDPVGRRTPFPDLLVEPVEQREIRLAAVPDHEGGDPAAFFKILEAEVHEVLPSVSQADFGRFQTMTPVPSLSFSKNAARIGWAKLGSSSFMAR